MFIFRCPECGHEIPEPPAEEKVRCETCGRLLNPDDIIAEEV